VEAIEVNKLVSVTKRTAAPKSHSSGSKQVSGVEMGKVLWATRAKKVSALSRAEFPR
jgi:hypothetical protein